MTAVRIADRMADFTSFIVMDILEAALALEQQGTDIVHLEVGEPDFPPPPPVMEAMARSMRDRGTHYTHSLGIIELREAIARHYLERFGLAVPPERICVTTGTSGAFLLLFGALLNAGDGVAISDPGYPCYPNFARIVGARPIRIPIRVEDGFQLTPQVLEQQDLRGAGLFVVSSPANPTGTITDRAAYRWLLERGHTVVSDEIYRGLVYTDQDEFTALQLSDDAIVVDGFSKRYAMTGCRLGWMVIPQGLVRTANKLSQNLFISAPTPSQWGGVAAMEQGWPHVEAMRREYARRRRVLLDGLKALSFKVGFEPQGAFYVFADVSAFSTDSYDFCLKMLHEAHVAAAPGIDFGEFRTRGYVRFSYTRSVDRIEEGLDRLRRWLRRD